MDYRGKRIDGGWMEGRRDGWMDEGWMDSEWEMDDQWMGG